MRVFLEILSHCWLKFPNLIKIENYRLSVYFFLLYINEIFFIVTGGVSETDS